MVQFSLDFFAKFFDLEAYPGLSCVKRNQELTLQYSIDFIKVTPFKLPSYH